MPESVVVSTAIVQCPVCGKKNRVPSAAAGVPRCGNCGSPLPWITDASDGDFGVVAEGAAIPVLVDLWAPWCGPCRMVSPTLERLAREMAGKVKLVKVNVDESPQLARRFAVQGIPTLIVMSGGSEVARQTGAGPEHQLRAWLEQALPQAAGDRGRHDRVS